jgi:hypothetical protein
VNRIYRAILPYAFAVYVVAAVVYSVWEWITGGA